MNFKVKKVACEKKVLFKNFNYKNVMFTWIKISSLFFIFLKNMDKRLLKGY